MSTKIPTKKNVEVSLNELKKQLTENSKINDQKELVLGENKIITIKKWSGKQIIEYGKVINDVEVKFLSTDGDDTTDLLTQIPVSIEQFLLKPSILEYDNYYFNDAEKLFLLFNLRKLSIPDIPLSVNHVCVHCNNQYKIETPVSDIDEKINIARNGVLTLSNGVSFEIGDIKNPKAMLNKSKEIKLLNELCLRINNISYNGNTTSIIIFDEVLDLIVSFNSVDLNELISTYINDFVFSYSLDQITSICPECSGINKIDYEDIVLLTQGI